MKNWKEFISKIDSMFRKKEGVAKKELSPIEEYNALMADTFRHMAKLPSVPMEDRMLYANGFERVDALDIDLYDIYG